MGLEEEEYDSELPNGLWYRKMFQVDQVESRDGGGQEAGA